MKITDITVRWRQTIKPREYEGVEGEITVKAVIAENEDADVIMARIMFSLRDKIALALGRKAPGIVDEQPAVEQSAAEKAAELMEPTDGADDTKLTDTSAQVDPAREPGKPSPGKSRRTKAEMAEDEAHDLAAMGDSPQPAGAAPSGGAAAPGGSVDFGDTDLGDMGDMAPADDGKTASLDDKVLQALAAAAAQKHGAEKVKEAIKDQNVARLGEMTQDQRHNFMVALGGL